MRVIKELPCRVDESKVANASAAQSRLVAEIEKVENKINATKAEWKARDKDLNEQRESMTTDLRKYARIVNEGVELRQVECRREVDREAGVVRIFRLDTKEYVKDLEEKLEEGPLFDGGKKKGAQQDLPKANAGAAVDWVMVIDVEGKKRKVPEAISERLRRSNREGLRCVHGFGADEPNVELAMVEGEPVYGVDAKGNGVPLTPGQVKVLRESFAARTPFRATVGGKDVEIVGLKGGPMIPSKPPEKASKKSAAKKGGRGRKAEARA